MNLPQVGGKPMSFNSRLSDSTGSMNYDTLVRSGTIKVPNRQSMLEEKQGYLEKKSSKSRFGISSWNKRYCVLQKGRLLMFHSE